LRGAYLRGANLRGANLRGANLSGAYLSDVSDICGASGNCHEVKAIQCDLWPVTYTAERMQIGCQFHTLAEWWAFTDDEISCMDGKALDWWQVWKPILQNIITLAPAVPGGAALEPTTEAA
ncbi:pentapeptide repeat-containing protein, partial [Pseudomonas veronii]|uniref:pentapeptide repeat-containing protein n=1 Tax=Pseudomonas veronii TaxID=76761 RepID=UPI0018E74CA5